MIFIFLKWRNRICLFSLGLLLLFLGCADPSPRSVTTAFYHWKNTLEVSEASLNYLSKLNTKKIYLRFFDVDWQSNAATPLSVMQYQKALPDSFEIIPTVFITNRTLLNIPKEDIPELCDKIFRKINHLSSHFKKNKIGEVQFDCDWSEKSRDNYFQLLRILKPKFAEQNQKISATIRLHQVKYFETTGVPEVDRGVLMFYNMGIIDDWETQNSILDLSLAKKYLYNFEKYPLPLDLALPIFKWGIVFQDGKLVKIINNLELDDLKNPSHFIKIAENRFELAKSMYLKGYYLYQKDQIRLEKVEPVDLQKTADLLSPILLNQELNLIFYHLDSTLISDYSHEALQDICDRFY